MRERANPGEVIIYHDAGPAAVQVLVLGAVFVTVGFASDSGISGCQAPR